mmetsp:Transcript_1995/g.6687  ORF Transcript_1995/g.6687 Transcript_1995/m.6687 type:complete len:209 (-) Transcript_1995:353-979(-)
MSKRTLEAARLATCAPPSTLPHITIVLSCENDRDTRAFPLSPSSAPSPPAPSCEGLASKAKVCWHSPVLGFHTLAVPSSEALTTSLPFGVNPPQVTPAWWPVKTCMHWPSALQPPCAASSPETATFHIQRVMSSLPASRTRPAGCHDTNSTASPGPSRAHKSSPVIADHTSTLPSMPPLARSFPVASKSTSMTVSSCPSSVMLFAPSE